MALLERQAEPPEQALSTAAASSAAYSGAAVNRLLDSDCGAEWLWTLICLSSYVEYVEGLVVRGCGRRLCDRVALRHL